MRLLLSFENPWCLFSLLLLICLLLIAAALLSYSRSRQRPALRPAPPEQPPRPAWQPEVTATAPFEALLAIQERLADMQRHLTPGSDDARWLEGFRNDLRNVMDDVYWELYHAQDDTRDALLERLDAEVARLNQTIGAHISATISRETDRSALHTQLDRLRAAVDEA
ncbi:MAG TPA: hypothetical protein VFZ66_19125 [Herpetosiphonaceae bacterium]